MSCPPNTKGISAWGPQRSHSPCLELLLLLCFSSGPSRHGHPVNTRCLLQTCGPVDLAWCSAWRYSLWMVNRQSGKNWKNDLGDLPTLQIRKTRSREGKITQPASKNWRRHEPEAESKLVSLLYRHCTFPSKQQHPGWRFSVLPTQGIDKNICTGHQSNGQETRPVPQSPQTCLVALRRGGGVRWGKISVLTQV